MNFGTFFRENLSIAINTIKGNKLRSSLTISIIAIGIMSMVGIFTAIDALKMSVSDSFSSLGSNSFSIDSRTTAIQPGGRRSRTVNGANITYDQAMEFKERFSVPSIISINQRVSGSAIIKYLSQKTNPNVRLIGTDENYLRNSGMNLEMGRNFSNFEVTSGAPVAIVGSTVAETLFGDENPIDKFINISGGRYRVVGVTKSKGGGMGMGNNPDQSVYITIEAARGSFTSINPNIPITVMPEAGLLDVATSEAEGLFRQIRKLKPTDDTDFSVTRSDSFINMMLENLTMITIVGTLIGFITIMGAAVGLMNIMLVSVSERTREIGTRMALGARPSLIRQQFLFESTIISQLGGLVGIVLGILMGNVVGVITGAGFFVPWGWIIFAVMVCLAVGLASGYLPARRASSLDPVEALRYE